MVKTIPSIYNEETKEWEEIYARSIAKDVFDIMKEDYLEHKGNLNFYIAKYKDGDSLLEQPNIVVFYDENNYEGMEMKEQEMTQALNEYIDQELQGKFKPFSLDKFLDYLKTYGYHLPEVFNVNISLSIPGTGDFKYPGTPSITNNGTVVEALKVENQKIDAKYIYNGHSIEDKKFSK